MKKNEKKIVFTLLHSLLHPAPWMDLAECKGDTRNIHKFFTFQLESRLKLSIKAHYLSI